MEKKREFVWLEDVSLKRWEYRLGQIFEKLSVKDGFMRSARVIMSPGELNRPTVMLVPVFYGCVSENKNRTANADATSDQQPEISDSKKVQLKLNIGQKFCTSLPILEGKI